ncbi:hypothetical protein LEP1GSC013_3502 [Leptospira interrogans serovar Valbuzzi str. Duyster]|uniref:hypothetical protein n=1 Tax=Leptospira interrogans TaxID=173 RepID=UPI0002BBB021|nr:hypothetical protein [Leptospira interrogans]EMJ52068.1 hypothetical protein LEP1GSC013_1025 [Leptospira interrogans serovar Valbuzzi str. Duyster]EMJ53644.1 hypothetical protein LEP1GSC013_1764 [Leptospira interrogans serovar Valbuzzi str. Duyster]EMJ54747.1 hypothetical protein LEP1GSC013_2473 [Leptospira interrogans serovar Valbuzzi str. Duyster]EMJ54751.1 hypothetical protein LEP1GSC013_2562 [Leptospira interrogans serovar Valbuzzi str. Duyster]EMJ55412.1 hypothetical protein LEP1GSC013
MNIEIVELVLMYTVMGTLAGWTIFGILGLLLWYLIFRVLLKELLRIEGSGYQPQENLNNSGNKFPPQEESGGA